ncbi:hypothetical protein AN946_02595 [Trueperella pyogenes]|nr:hypothetical protein AN946_02595 [Trueperella pyogenes]
MCARRRAPTPLSAPPLSPSTPPRTPPAVLVTGSAPPPSLRSRHAPPARKGRPACRRTRRSFRPS